MTGERRSVVGVVGDLLRRAVVENAALKIVALLLSVTLFIVVHGDKDTVISFYLKVGYTEPSDRVVTSQLVDSVRVTVKGPWTRIKRFDDRELEPLHVDLSDLADGEYSFPEDKIRLPPGIRITSINPPTIRLQFESTATKIVAVTPALEGDLDPGFHVERRTANPSHVMVRGPKRVVDALTEVKTRTIAIGGRREPFREKVALATSDEHHVTVVDPVPVEVEVVIVEKPAELRISRLPVTIRPPHGVTGFVTEGAAVAPGEVEVVLRGGWNAVEQVRRDAVTAHVELHAEDLIRRQSRAAQVQIEGVPPGVAIEVHPREITLTAPKGAGK